MEIVLSFSMLYGAFISLICAVLILNNRNNKLHRELKNNCKEEE